MAKRNNQRGFTIAECIIAMAIIMIVSVSAVGTIESTAKSTSKDFLYYQARIYTENALEAFKYAPDHYTFLNEVTSDGFTYNGTQYIMKTNFYTIYLTAKFTNGARDTFIARVTDGDGKLIMSFSYNKG